MSSQLAFILSLNGAGASSLGVTRELEQHPAIPREGIEQVELIARYAGTVPALGVAVWIPWRFDLLLLHHDCDSRCARMAALCTVERQIASFSYSCHFPHARS